MLGTMSKISPSNDLAGDASLPAVPGLEFETEVRSAGGLTWRAHRFSPAALAQLMAALTAAERGLRALDDHDLLAAWQATVADFRHPDSPPRRRLEGALAELTGLSPAGLAAGLEAVLGGVAGRPVAELFARARRLERAGELGPVAVILASNLPALAVQPLLPALALRRPVLLKSASAEPLFAPAFVDALCHRERRLRPALAALTWTGGDAELEQPVLEGAARVLAYGGGDAMADLERRAGDRLVAFGPKISLAAIGRGVAPESVAEGLARDIALFDQRGCLSVQAIYTTGEPAALARDLARALAETADRWPMGILEPGVASAVRQLRDESMMRGLTVADLPPRQGTVIVDPDSTLRPSPGGRTVLLHPLENLAHLPDLLAPWSGRLQGLAAAGDDALALGPAFERLGVTRIVPPGELQSADALWHNGGESPLEILR